MPATATLIIKGLIVVFVNKQRTKCTVGVLGDSPPDHKLTITFRRPNAVGDMEEYKTLTAADIAYNLHLDVKKISQDQITFRNLTAIDRLKDPTAENEDSFSWVVDFESLELYSDPIGAKKSGFSPLLTFTNGDLFSFFVSRGPLFTQRGLFSPSKKFGFVATAIGAEFRLDQADSTAVFRNGGQAIPIPDPTQNWEIEINNDADAHFGIVTDANNYYKAVGLDLAEQQRILFMSVAQGGGPAGPEAACFTGFMGQSELTG